MPFTVPDNAQCIACGYPLKQLLEPRCPECGKAFDPANPKTMHTARPVGPVGRYWLSSTGWWPVLALCTAAGLALFSFRWPTQRPHLSLIDLHTFFPKRGLLWQLVSPTDWAYVAALSLVDLIAIYLTLRLIARRIARRSYRREPVPTNPGRRQALAVMALAITGASTLLGWPFRLARHWVRSMLRDYDSGTFTLSLPPKMDGSELEVLRAGVIQLPTPRERIGAIKLLIELYAKDAPPILLEALTTERDPDVLATAIHLLGFYRDPKVLPNIMKFWDDANPEVRAAATDCVGLIHAPAYEFLHDDDDSGSIKGDPKIGFRQIEVPPEAMQSIMNTPASQGLSVQARGEQALPDAIRLKLIDRVKDGQLNSDREAAARSLLRWQTVGNFRFAEWGIFLNHAGNWSLIQPALDEIPPFVHRAGQTLADIQNRVTHQYAVLKPIIHIQTDRLLVVDIETVITSGRVWFAYPKPDDFIPSGGFSPFGNGTVPRVQPPFLRQFDPPNFPKMDDVREGYPWLSPAHRVITSPSPAENPYMFNGLGVCWQSLIVSPEKLSWMRPPDVPSDPKFFWWERLRKVPCNWVSSRGETDRFLYYDGPSAAASPMSISYSGRTITINFDDAGNNESVKAVVNSFVTKIIDDAINWQRHRIGIFIEFQEQLAARMIKIDFADNSSTVAINVDSYPSITGEAVADALRKLLIGAGLSSDEADGLIDSWRPAFFEKPGRRFLLLMDPREYEAMCPIRVDPRPNEMVRVGLVWTEFP